jgi:ATP phosphoribosyltransferase regulatory subunit
VARIDAHSLAQEGVTRLCYAGSVLHTRPKTLMASRSPIQLGAELYGDNSLAADVEVIRLMLASLEVAGRGVAGRGVAGGGAVEPGPVGLNQVSLDLGHVGVYEAVLDTLILNADQEQTVFDALQRKSVPDLEEALADADEGSRELVIALVDLHGDERVLGRARELFAERVPAALAAIDAVQEVAADILSQRPDLNIYYDLAELRGYHYHTGMVFAAYVPGHGQALANGGRYNDVGSVFGRARPATGFAIDLKALVDRVAGRLEAQGAISMPDSDDPALARKAAELRSAGHIVINCLSSAPDPRCDRQLAERDGDWVVEDLPSRSH